MIAARFNPGAISESSLSHLPPSETSPLIPTNALYWTSRVSLRPRIGAAGFDRPLFTSRTVKLVQPISQIGVMVMAAEKTDKLLPSDFCPAVPPPPPCGGAFFQAHYAQGRIEHTMALRCPFANAVWLTYPV
jgi:hypothetical protein